jgi:hypothetical protein
MPDTLPGRVAARLAGTMFAATIPAEDGSYAYQTQGQVVFYGGKIWRNLLPTDTPNVFPPPTNWREYPMGVEHPVWVQPSGAFDAYPLDFVVEHDGVVWGSAVPANVWEPGVGAEWTDLTPAPEVPEWVQPTGAHDAYNIGDRVLFETVVYESVIDGNTYSPTEYPAGWSVVEVT